MSSSQNPTKLLITGGLGFIGTNLIARLSGLSDVSVRILDYNPTRPSYPPLQDPSIEVHTADILNREAVDKAVQGCDSIVHLAASTGVVESIQDPRQSLHVNIDGTLNLLEAARTFGVKRFVFASSNAAVGNQSPPLCETQVAAPVSPYGAGKASCENLLSGYAQAFGLQTAALRFSNVYGIYSGHKGSVVARMFRAVLDGEPLTLYGDGEQTRDFVFVEDLCNAIWLALNHAPAGSVFQIASGVETRIAELAETIKRLIARDTSKEVPVRYEPPRKGDVLRNYSDIALAREQLGFKPTVDLDDGLERVWQWFQQMDAGSRFAALDQQP